MTFIDFLISMGIGMLVAIGIIAVTFCVPLLASWVDSRLRR